MLPLIVLASCQPPQAGRAAGSVNHDAWNELLASHVDGAGMVDYQGFIRDSVKLDAYLAELSRGIPSAEASRDERIAYWINAYNAFTVKLIADNYPVNSIKDLNPALSLPTVNTVWTKKWFTIGGEPMSLDNIEHDILRKEFDEPRIHFAINCASVSCPRLRQEAYSGESLDRQLQEQAMEFINDPLRNDITDPENPRLSLIFRWFSGDFTDSGSVTEFINSYAETPVTGEISYLEYDWRLNDYPRTKN